MHIKTTNGADLTVWTPAQVGQPRQLDLQDRRGAVAADLTPAEAAQVADALVGGELGQLRLLKDWLAGASERHLDADPDGDGWDSGYRAAVREAADYADGDIGAYSAELARLRARDAALQRVEAWLGGREKLRAAFGGPPQREDLHVGCREEIGRLLAGFRAALEGDDG